MAIPVLGTKLYPTRLRPGLISRPVLAERLTASLWDGDVFARKLSLICAPAGYGKSTLAAEWLASLPCPSTWLSLDPEDNDPSRFIAYLLAALAAIEPALPAGILPLLQSPQPPPSEMLLTTLINSLATSGKRFLLVLDDYHAIHLLAIHQMLGFLLEHQPRGMHLVIATREDPPLPLARLRALGQMAEIRQADLRFSVSETQQFMNQAEVALSHEDIEALQRRTEGWAAGLQLAVLSLQGQKDAHHALQSFTGSNRHILDYLMDEVFREQSTSVQMFLTETSILDRFTASLCDAVTGRQDSAEMLLSLDRRNLFVIELDDSRIWYRYHHLFRDLLRHRLSATERRHISVLHRRASEWYQANGFITDAVGQALAGADWERATALISAHSTELLKQGQVMTLLGWYSALPDETMRANPRLSAERAWPLILTDQIDAAELCLDQAEKALGGHVEPRGGILAARAYVARTRGDMEAVIDLSEQALAAIPRDDLSSRSVVALNLGIAYLHRGYLEEARRAFTEARIAGQATGNHYAQLTGSIFLARVQAARGHLYAAEAALHCILDQGSEVPIFALAHAHLSGILYERNNLGGAVEHARHAVELARQTHNVETMAAAQLDLARAQQALGDRVTADKAVSDAEALLESPGVSVLAQLHGLSARARLAILQADYDRAQRLLETASAIGETRSFPDALRLIGARAHLFLTQGRREEATQLLNERYDLATGMGWQEAVIDTLALRAIAESRPDASLASLDDAMALASRGGYVRTFVDLGEPMIALLHSTVERSPNGAYAKELLRAAGTVPAPAELQHPDANWQLVEPLSQRELEVLGLLARGQTYREMALALYLSVNTVKTHLKNLYGKLGVLNRRQATIRARELGLIE